MSEEIKPQCECRKLGSDLSCQLVDPCWAHKHIWGLEKQFTEKDKQIASLEAQVKELMEIAQHFKNHEAWSCFLCGKYGELLSQHKEEK